MFNLSVLNGFKTVGTFILYKDTLVFMIGPDHTGKKLGIMRIGGHIEDKENYKQSLEREIKEEASIQVKYSNSPCTFYQGSWDDTNYFEINDDLPLEIKPLIIVGDGNRSTAVFLAYSDVEPRPSSEAHGLIFLKEDDIKDICSNRLCLQDFLNKGGKLIQQREIDYETEIYAGVHLKFFNRLLQEKNELARKYLYGELIKGANK